MPLDNLVYRPLLSQREFFRRAHWQLKFVWWPRRCGLSDKRIWLKRAYCGTAVWTGPGDSVYEYRWLTKESFTVAALGGIIRGKS
jgi:hypothetical protein